MSKEQLAFAFPNVANTSLPTVSPSAAVKETQRPATDPPKPGASDKAMTRIPEVATVFRAEWMNSIAINYYPNLSTIMRDRSEGQFLGFYETMWKTDADMSGLFDDLWDDVQHHPVYVFPASTDPRHLEHAQFLRFSLRRLPRIKRAARHALTSQARGFAVLEKVYEYVTEGQWTGAVIVKEFLDKPQKWFAFDRKRNLLFRTTTNPYPGEPVPEGKFVVVRWGSIADPWGAPILDDLYWPWFIKHHAIKHQAIYFEKWASPQAIAKYKRSASTELAKKAVANALEVLQALQADSSAAVPDDLILELLESTRNGSVSFESYIDQWNKTMARKIAGQVLMSSGDKGGSYALGKVVERRLGNKVEATADFLSTDFYSEFGRDLIERNFGPQDEYPRVLVLAENIVEKVAQAEFVKLAQQNGHAISKSWMDEVLQIVVPSSPEDALVPIPSAAAAQVLPPPPGLASPEDGAAVALASHVHAIAASRAQDEKGRIEKARATASGKAKPAIRQIARQIAGKIRRKKNISSIKRSFLYGAMKGIDTGGLGAAFSHMFKAPEQAARFASDNAEDPTTLDFETKLALALQLLSLVETIHDAGGEANDVADLADTIESDGGIGDTSANMFDAVHGTNVATIQTGLLRRRLEDPAYRAAYPYVVIVVTNPNARLGHAMMNGYILSAEDARHSNLLPPYDFGCDCLAIPISAEEARAAGITGANPSGTLEAFLKRKGATRPPMGGPWEFVASGGTGFTIGPARGFSSAFPTTDTFVQIDAIRQKAEEIRRKDPEGWASLHAWLLWLFGFDVLRNDRPPDTQAA